MAFCTKCGKELRDGDKFCFYCGEPVRDGSMNRKDYFVKNDRNGKEGGKKFNGRQLSGGIAVVAVVAIAACFLLWGGKDSDVQREKDETRYDGIEDEIGTEAEMGTGDAADAPNMISEVIKEIENQSGYVSDSYWEPLAAADDFNGDGIQDLLAVYEVNSGAGINVMYDLWGLKESGAQKLKSEVLFTEVGGNNGIVGIIKSGSEISLAVCQYEPEAELFNNYYTYFLWEKNNDAPGLSGYYLESHGNYEQEDEGTYILGDTRVEKSEFDAKYKELDQWVYKLDLLGGASDGVKTFDQWVE